MSRQFIFMMNNIHDENVMSPGTQCPCEGFRTAVVGLMVYQRLQRCSC